MKLQDRAAEAATTAATKHKQKHLRFPVQAQDNYYYCGPAVMSMVLSAKDISLSQKECAKLLDTDDEKTTPFRKRIPPIVGYSYYPMQDKTNEVLFSRDQPTWYEAKDHHQGVDLAQRFPQDLVYNIDHNWPLMVHVIERENKIHLRGHPYHVHIEHWITVYGYSEYGTTAWYVDSAHRNISWSGAGYYTDNSGNRYYKPAVLETNSIATSDLVSLMYDLGYIA
jgi:hypothetical protein